MRDELPFPVALIQDRYGGCYSGGAWLAIAAADRLENGAYRIIRSLEGGPHGDDGDASAFWLDPPAWIAAGDTPDEALNALVEKQVGDRQRLAALDARIAAASADIEAGRVHSVEDVKSFLRARRARGSDAAG